MATKDTDQDVQDAPAAPAAQDGANNGHHARDTVEIAGREVPVLEEGEEFQDEQTRIGQENVGDVSPEEEAYVAEENAAAAAGVDEPEGVKVDARQEDLRRQLGEILPRPDAPADVLQAFVDRLLGRDVAAAELRLRQEPVEVNREIECQIYGHRTSMLAGSPNPRTYLTIAFDGVRHAKLSGLLGANLKGTIRINVIDLQAPLEADDEADLPDAGVPVQAALQPLTQERRRSPEDLIADREEDHRVAYMTDGAGHVYKAHGFAPSPQDAKKCALCNAGETHDVHAGKKRQTARRALRNRAEMLLEHVWTPVRQDAGSPEACAFCDLPHDAPIHNDRADELPTFADRVVYWRDVEGLEEGIAWARADEDAAADPIRCLPATESDALARKLLDGAVAGAAPQDVAADLEAPIPDAELTDEQRDARRRLANGSGS